MENTPFCFSLSATFTAEPLEPVLRFWERRLAAKFDIRFAPYNQVLQTLASDFGVNRHGINIILARAQDLNGAENFRDLLSVTRRFAEQPAVPLIFVLCPPGESMAQEAQTQLTGIPGLHFVSPEAISQMYPVADPASEQGERLGQVPYTELYYCALGTALVRLADSLARPPGKVIALDCDNTLWRGICGEDGPAAVQPDHALQQFMLAQHRAGMLLTLVSKNNEQDVLDTFAAHPEMPLQLHHFTAWRLNWEEKPANLASLASELSLGLDAFIFVDDSAKETAEVEEGLPQVLSLTLPKNGNERFLQHVWAFDHASVTEADRKRSASYAQVQEFGRELKRAENLRQFMETLGLRVIVRPAEPADLPRVAQLTQRTNQFNLSGIRRTEAQLAGLECFTVDVHDRFGDYPLTGAVIFRAEGDTLEIDSFVLSCRVLGRGVEHQVMRHIGQEALRRGLQNVAARLIATKRNRPAAQFLNSIGKEPFRFATADLLTVQWQPEPQAEDPTLAAIATAPAKRPDYAAIARDLATPEQIRDAMRVPVTADPTLTETEQRLAAIWAGLLHRSSISASDNFFDLGGHSLLMVQMVMRVRETFGVELGIDDVYSATLTLAGLARKIEGGSDDDDALLREIENMSDEEVARLLAEESLTEV